jgi:hypothetical protein
VSIGASAPIIAAFQKQFQQVAAQVGGNATNGSYLPSLIASGSPLPTGFFDPNFKTPRSLQMNAGVQRQLWRGALVSADYLRNVATHYGLGQDINHIGDVRFFNMAAAQTAVATTLANCGVGSINQALVSCPTDPANGTTDSGTWVPRAATMVDFASNGLGTPADAHVGACAPAAGVNFRCAFGGVNPNNAAFIVQKPIGRSTYDALQIKFVQNSSHPFRGVRALNFQAAYSLSSFKNAGGASSTSPGTPGSGDQDFVIGALDNANPLKYFGWGPLDRKNQLSFGGVADFPGGFRVGVVSHFYSPLPLGLYVPNTGSGSGEIFRTDFTGDGTVQDPLPGTQVGSLGRNVSYGGLVAAISNYNSTFANQATPAGKVLVSNNLFTLAQLQALGGVAPSVPAPVPGQVPMFGLKTFDLRLSWVHKFRERLTVEPSVSFFNAFNFANFDLPQSTLNPLLTGAPGSVNGTTYNDQTTQRVGVGTGVYSLGAPRVIEWGLKLTF